VPVAVEELLDPARVILPEPGQPRLVVAGERIRPLRSGQHVRPVWVVPRQHGVATVPACLTRLRDGIWGRAAAPVMPEVLTGYRNTRSGAGNGSAALRHAITAPALYRSLPRGRRPPAPHILTGQRDRQRPRQRLQHPRLMAPFGEEGMSPRLAGRALHGQRRIGQLSLDLVQAKKHRSHRGDMFADSGVKRTVAGYVGDSSAWRTIRAMAALAMHRCQAAPAEA
jgi:hypothetical protein